MDRRKLAGNWGEAVVAAYLRKNGYRIERGQFRCRMGEVDLIAEKNGVLCFVEVKTRRETEHGLPREFVSPAKQRRVRTAAAQYLALYDLDCPVRFDVAEVYSPPGALDAEHAHIEYLEAAFE